MSGTNRKFTLTESGSGVDFHMIEHQIIGMGAVSRFDIMHNGEPYQPSFVYSVPGASAITIPTANDHIWQIIGSTGSLRTLLRRMDVFLSVPPAAATRLICELRRTTSAGTGGVAVVAGILDPVDATATTAGMTKPSAKGTETTVAAGGLLGTHIIDIPNTAAAGTLIYSYSWGTTHLKPPTIAAGAANGIVLKQLAGLATATIFFNLYVSEVDYS